MRHIIIATGIFPPEIGGPASYGKTLAEKLSKEFQVTLITYSVKTKHAEDKSLPFKVIRVSKKIPKFFRHLAYFFQVYTAAKKADVIFGLNVGSAGVPAFWAAKKQKKKFFVKVVGDHAWETAVNTGQTMYMIDDFQRAQKKGWIKFLANSQARICKKADGVIVPSKYLARMVHTWGVPNDKIHTIYNGVEFPHVELSREDARKKIGIPGAIIVSAGRLVPWKGFRMLIKLMPKLLQINQFFRLVIVGGGPDYQRLQLMVKNLGLDRKVILTGKKSQDELALYLAAAEMFVLNTGYEGFSHQILEAMLVGLPVITTSVGGNKEVIVQGKNGFLVKYNDEFNIVEAVKTLWQSPEMREQLGEEGKKIAGLFDPEAMYQKTIAVLKS